MKTARLFVLALSCALCIQNARATNILIPSGVKNPATEEANRALVLDFWANFFNGHTDEWAKWLSPDFVNHDPFEPNGGKAFADFVAANARRRPASQKAPPSRSTDRLFVMADGDLVLVVYPGDNPLDITENVHGNIVRVKNGKITDWWLIGQFPGRAGPKKPYPDRKTGVQPRLRTPAGE